MDAAVFGLIVADLLASPMDIRRPPAPGGLQIVDRIELATGGNVPNTGIAMAKLGMKVAAAGMVGKDVLGNAVIERLNESGVDTSCVFADARAQTSATVVAVEPGGERAFFHVPGATKLLDADVFRRCIPMFAKCKFVQIGYFGLLPTLTPDLPVVLRELRAAAPNTFIALDTVNPPADRKLLEPILPLVHVFAPSRTEAAALTGETDPRKMILVFRRIMPMASIIGIKLDAEGCVLDNGMDMIRLPAYKVDVVDTTGAGDTWFGGAAGGAAPKRAAGAGGKIRQPCSSRLLHSAGRQRWCKIV